MGYFLSFVIRNRENGEGTMWQNGRNGRFLVVGVLNRLSISTSC